MNRNLIILVFILIVMVVLDLSLGIGYVNKKNLHFDPENFNNILSPMFSLLALFASLIALLFSFNQNKLALSQNLKPHYELEIENLKNKALELKIEPVMGENSKNINALNYISEIQSKLMRLFNNNHFQEDYNNFTNGKTIEGTGYFQLRSYFPTLLFLTNFTTVLSETYFFNSSIKDLIERIDDSKLIDEDKLLLKKRIRREFLEPYIVLIRFMKENPRIVVSIPDIVASPGNKIIFKSMADTNFAAHWDWFDKNL